MIQNFFQRSDCIRLFLLRHGHDTGSLIGDPKRELTDNGVRQATCSAELLSAFQFDLFFASDLLRTHQTAKIIGEKQRSKLQLTSSLREIRPFYLMGNPEMTDKQGKPIQNFLAKIAQVKQGAMILAVSHCHLIRYILTLTNCTDNKKFRTVQEMHDMGLFERQGCTIDMSHCALSMIEIDSKGRLEPKFINYHKHTAISP